MDVIFAIVTRYLFSFDCLSYCFRIYRRFGKIFSSFLLSRLSEESRIYRKTISDSNIVCIFEQSQISFEIGLLSLRGETSGFLQSWGEVILRSLVPIKIDFPPARDVSNSFPTFSGLSHGNVRDRIIVKTRAFWSNIFPDSYMICSLMFSYTKAYLTKFRFSDKSIQDSAQTQQVAIIVHKKNDFAKILLNTDLKIILL